MPDSTALPTSESRSGPRYSGKMETMSMRIRTPASGVRGLVVQQAAGRIDHDPPRGEIHARHDLLDERHEHLAAALAPHGEQV